MPETQVATSTPEPTPSLPNLEKPQIPREPGTTPRIRDALGRIAGNTGTRITFAIIVLAAGAIALVAFAKLYIRGK